MSDKRIDYNLDVPFKEFMPGQIIQSVQFNDNMEEVEEKVNEVIFKHNLLVTETEEHLDNIENPHSVTAHQVGTYITDEIDEFVENLRNAEFYDKSVGNRVLEDESVDTRVIKNKSITAIKVDDAFGNQIDISKNMSITDRYTKEEVNNLLTEKVGEGTYSKEELNQMFEDVQAGQIVDKTIGIDKLKDNVGRLLDISANKSITGRYTKEEVDVLIQENGLPRDWGGLEEIVEKQHYGHLPVANVMTVDEFVAPSTPVLDIDVREVVGARNGHDNLGERLNSIDSQLEQNTKNLKYTNILVDDISTLQNIYDNAPEGSTIKLSYGTHNLSSKLVFNRKINLDFNGAIIKYVGTDEGSIITIGNDSIRIDSIDIDIHLEQVVNWDVDRTGIEVINIRNSILKLSSIGFRRNILANAKNNHPNCYNKYFLNLLDTGKIQLELTCSADGWTNENIFFGGNFSYYSGKDTTDCVCVKIDSIDYRLNNNKFYGCSFEDYNMKATSIYIGNGANNSFYDCRYEGAKKVTFESNSMYNLLSFGWDLEKITLNDAGLKNTIISNSYQKMSGGSSDGIIIAKQVGSVNYKTFVSKNSNETETFYVTANGKMYVNDKLHSNYGFEFGSISEPRGIYRGYGSPEGKITARGGSLFIDMNGSIYLKTTDVVGGDNVGWKKLLTSE